MILFTPVPAVATPKTALAAIATATGPSDASRATTGAGRASATAATVQLERVQCDGYGSYVLGRKGRAAKNSVLTSGVKQLKC